MRKECNILKLNPVKVSCTAVKARKFMGIKVKHSRYCIRIRRRRGIYGEIWPEPKGVPEGAARGNSRGFRPYFAVYPESSPNTDIISFLKVTLWPFSVLPSEVGLYWKS